MSININLVEMPEIEGVLTEENNIIIDSVLLPEYLYEKLENEKYIDSLTILEASSDDTNLEHTDTYELNVIQPTKVQITIDLLLRDIDTKISELQKELLTAEDKDILLNDLTVLLNIRKILRLKTNEYATKSNVVLLLG